MGSHLKPGAFRRSKGVHVFEFIDVSLGRGQKSGVAIKGLDGLQKGYVVVGYFTGGDI